MKVKQEVITPIPETTTPPNLASWHLVSTQSFYPQQQSLSQKPSLKIKIVRNSGTVEQATSRWKESLVKQEVSDQKPTPRMKMMMPQKRTPWYLLPSKSTAGQEPRTSKAPAPTYQKPVSKHRVANKPKQCWNSPLDLAGELQMKMESLKQKLLKPPKRKLTPAEQTTTMPSERQVLPAEYITVMPPEFQGLLDECTITKPPEHQGLLAKYTAIEPPEHQGLLAEYTAVEPPERQGLLAEYTAVEPPERQGLLAEYTAVKPPKRQDLLSKSLECQGLQAEHLTAKSPKRKRPPLGFTTAKSLTRQSKKQPGQEDGTTYVAQHTTAAASIHLEPAVDFGEAKKARKRAEQLFDLRVLQLKTKREGFKRPTCSKRLVKTTVMTNCTEDSDLSMYPSQGNDNPSLPMEDALKEGKQQFESKEIHPNSMFGGFKIRSIPKDVDKTSISSSSNALSLISINNHHPNESMKFMAKENALHNIFESKEIQPTQMIGRFKIPSISNNVAKTATSSSCNALSKAGSNNQISNPPVDFAAAREARKKAEQLVKSGRINFEVKTTAADFKQPTCSKHLNTFEEFISKKGASFSSLSENFQDSKRTWSNYVDNVYASFASKADSKKTYEPNEMKNHKVNLSTTIYVTATDVSKKFLLTAFAKFGTITAILTNTRNAACVKFYGTNAAHCACVDMNGALALGRIAMQVRMAEDEDWATMLQLNNAANAPRHDKLVNSQQRPPVWFEIAAGKAQTTSHSETRELVTYTADDMIF